MSDGFDPYHSWLGIRPDEQPPDHYRLLGIARFESDPVVIGNAADRQMAHLRTFQTGPRSALSQRLLNEVAAAKICLINPQKRAAYDETLRAALVPVVAPQPARWTGQRRPSSPRIALVAILAGMAVVVVLLVVGLYALATNRSAKEPKATPPESPPAASPRRDPAPAVPVDASSRPSTDHPPEPATDAVDEPDKTPAERAVPPRTEPAPSEPSEPPAVAPRSEEPPAPHVESPSPAAAPPPEEPPLATPSDLPARPSGETPDSPASRPSVEERPDRPVARVAPPGELPIVATLACRYKRYRAGLLAKYGGTAQTENAVAAALEWIVANQFPDGGWDFAHSRNPQRAGRGRNPGQKKAARNAATGLALMTLLGAGNTHRAGEYKKNVGAGLQFLIGRMQITPAGGSFRELDGTMYSQAMATIALSEALAMSRDARLRMPTQQAIRFICNAQDPKGGGWRYEPRQSGDTSVFGWQIAALSAGHYAGRAIPNLTLVQAMGYLDGAQYDEGRRYGYDQPSGGTDATTAIGLLSRIHLGWARNTPALIEGVRWVGQKELDRADIYFDYYATQLMFHYGGADWESWNPRMQEFLLASQVGAGDDEQGSWFVPGGLVNQAGGRLYYTALATLMLETYYRYPFLPTK